MGFRVSGGLLFGAAGLGGLRLALENMVVMDGPGSPDHEDQKEERQRGHFD